MKYTDPYRCDYLKFFIDKRIDPYNDRDKEYELALHPLCGMVSREELKGLADFIYKYLENN